MDNRAVLRGGPTDATARVLAERLSAVLLVIRNPFWIISCALRRLMCKAAGAIKAGERVNDQLFAENEEHDDDETDREH